MAKGKRRRRTGVERVLERKEVRQATEQAVSRGEPARAAAEARAADPSGSCRYADGFGQIQCESPVAKSYCDGKSGFFTPDGRC